MNQMPKTADTTQVVLRKPDLTVFVPAFNEEHNIIKALEAICDAADKLKVKAEVLVYDDCSTDLTSEMVARFQTRRPEGNVRLVRNQRTMGLGFNYVEAAFAGSGEHFMLVNGDADMDSEQIQEVIKHLGKADMVLPFLGSQDARKTGRRYLSKLFTALINIISGYRITYYNGPVLHRRYNVMRWHPDTMGFAYQAELVTRLLDQGASFLEVPIANTDRDSGVSKALSLKNFLSVTHSILQIFLRRVRKAIFSV
jgi:glycosyltransferase involved in cell wall biosynthesis